jgi:hypothetical protein
MWIAECDQGDAGHAGKGIMEGPLFQRRVALGQDEFSREVSYMAAVTPSFQILLQLVFGFAVFRHNRRPVRGGNGLW